MTGLIARFGLLLLAAVSLGVMLVFALTPLAWELAGRPSESYPEILFFTYGLAFGVLAVAGGIVSACRKPAEQRGRAWTVVHWVSIISVGVCVLLAADAVITLPIGESAWESLLGMFLLGAPVLAVLLLAATPAAIRR